VHCVEEGIKRYIITAIDEFNCRSFAKENRKLNSRNAMEFMVD
jgi:hypothetical protein